jgi:hypothetical protein
MVSHHKRCSDSAGVIAALLALVDIYFAGRGEDEGSDDAEGTAVLEIHNSAGNLVGGDSADWLDDGFGNLVAEVTDTYDAATGGLDLYRGSGRPCGQLADAVPTLITACGAVLAAFSQPPKLVRRRT